MKTIQVEDETWETLVLRKVRGKYSSFDQLIKDLLNKTHEQKQATENP